MRRKRRRRRGSWPGRQWQNCCGPPCDHLVLRRGIHRGVHAGPHSRHHICSGGVFGNRQAGTRPLPHHASVPLPHKFPCGGRGRPFHLERDGVSADEGGGTGAALPVLLDWDESVPVKIPWARGPFTPLPPKPSREAQPYMPPGRQAM